MYLNWIRLSFIYLIIAAFLGLAMRTNIAALLGLPYNNLLHAHSHIAFLGWVYPALIILLINKFLAKEKLGQFKWQLIISHILIAAILAAFVLQGYGFYSILFSSLFQFMNYWFIITFWRALKKEDSHPVPLILVKISLISLLVSTFGPWALAGIMSSGARSDIYNMAIYFYLHFQYNGWILFALSALFFRQIKDIKQAAGIKNAVNFMTCFSFALVPAYCLSLLGIFHTAWNFSLAALAAYLQLQALYYFTRFLWINRRQGIFNIAGRLQLVLACSVLLAVCLKLLLQILSVIPALSGLAFNNHNIVIAYLHLTLIGIVTSCLILFFLQNKLLDDRSPVSGLATGIFLAGFGGVEILLGFQFTGFIIYSFREALIFFTILLAGGLTLFLPSFRKV